MNTNFTRTAAWLKACGKEQTPANLSLQIGCHLEEQIEFLGTLEIHGPADNQDAYHARRAIQTAIVTFIALADSLKKGHMTASIPPEQREAALDALCDCDVTGNGVAYFAGFDKVGADQTVLASNEAKLIDGKPVILEGGKIGKPEGWTAPDLTPFV